MPKTVITEKIAQFIKANRFKMSQSRMAEHCGVSKSAIRYFMRKNNLCVPKEYSAKFRSEALKRPLKEKEDEYIKQHLAQKSIKQIAIDLKRSSITIQKRVGQLGLSNISQEKKQNSYFKKGHTPKNKGRKQVEFMSAEGIENSAKTRFKKGNESWNKKPVGSERISNGYIYIKTAEPNKYELKHRMVYRQNFGEIPKAYNVQFKDGNPLNCTPENLYIVSKAEQVRHNQNGGKNLPHEAKKVITTITKLNKKIKNIENEK